MSRKMRMALSGIALVVIVAMAWFFLISPLRAQIATTNAAISAEQTKIAAAEAKLKQAQVTRTEGQKNQARLIELAKMVPDSGQVPSLLVQIQDLADQSGITFDSVTPGDVKEANGFQIIPLTLQFTGTYFDLSDFAYRAEQLVAAPGRLLTVKSVSLRLGGTTDSTSGSTKKTKGSPELKISMTLYAFCMDQSTVAQTTTAAATTGQTGTTATTGAGATTITTAQ
jgi:Tfp pilus assembly protein PilO